MEAMINVLGILGFTLAFLSRDFTGLFIVFVSLLFFASVTNLSSN